MKSDCIDMRNNGARPETKPECKPEHRTFNIKLELNAADLMKIIALIGGNIITCFLIVFAYSAGMMFGILVLVGFLAFLALMLKSMK